MCLSIQKQSIQHVVVWHFFTAFNLVFQRSIYYSSAMEILNWTNVPGYNDSFGYICSFIVKYLYFSWKYEIYCIEYRINNKNYTDKIVTSK